MIRLHIKMSEILLTSLGTKVVYLHCYVISTFTNMRKSEIFIILYIVE